MPRLVSAALILFLATTTWFAWGVRAQGQPQEGGPLPQPGTSEQPLAFSHLRHVGQAGMDCQYCHVYARRGPVAGIPSVQRCVQCHFVIAKDQPEIGRLMDFWNRKEPIPWVRVHRLPDYVRFSHQRHVTSGVQCQTCHGDVGRMDVAVQIAPLTMGWCLTCHDDRQAPRDCLICHD